MGYWLNILQKSLLKMKHVATYLLLVLGGNDSPTADDVADVLSSVGIDSDRESLERFMSEMKEKTIDELMSAGKGLLASLGNNGGSKIASSENEAVKEEEEEEMDMSGGMDMFGGDDDGEGY